MTHEEVSELLGAFALDAVDQDEYEQIEAHLSECPRCRAEVDAHREVAAALGNSVEPLPEGLWSNIASRLPLRQDEEVPPMPLLVRDDEAPGTPAPVFHAPRAPRLPRAGRGRLAVLGSIAVAAAAVAVVLGVNVAHDDHQIAQLHAAVGTSAHAAVLAALDTPGRQVVHLEGPNQKQLAEFVIVPDGRGYLVKSTLPALSSGQTYQLWGVSGRRTISLGILGQSPHEATFTSAGSRPPSSLAITVEPAGGSVIPTPPMLVTGTI
jgi:anti-sigma-K factor RskA